MSRWLIQSWAIAIPISGFKAVFHKPRFYRYVVANPGIKFRWNRYGVTVIGLAIVIGKYAYCVKWADAKCK